MDGMRERRGQPQAANRWCFNRHLNAVNLAASNGGVDFLVEKDPETRFVLRAGNVGSTMALNEFTRAEMTTLF